MKSKNKLAKNILIFSIGNLGSRFLVFLLVPLYSFYLDTSEMGYYDMVVVTSGLLIPIIGVQLSESIYRWLLEAKKDEELKKILSSALITLCFTVLIGLLLFGISSFFLNIKHTVLIGGYFLSVCLYPFILAVARGMQLNKLYAISGVINSAILVFFNWLLLAVFSFGVEALLIANISANFVAMIILVIGTKLYKNISIKSFSKPLVLSFIEYSLPLVPNAVSWWFINSVNRYLILYFLSQNSNGIYALSSRLAMALYALNSIFNLAWKESAITEFDKESRDEFYTEVFNKYFVLEMTAIILLIPISKVFVLYFVAPEYSESWRYIPVLYIGVAFATFSTFFGTGYLSVKKTKGAFFTTIYGAVANVLLAFVLIPRIGLQGAALGLTVGFLITFLCRVKQTRKYFHIKFDFKNILIISSLTLISLFLVFVFDELYSLLVFIFIASGIFVFFNRSFFQKIISRIRTRAVV